MADIEFLDVGKSRDRTDILIIEPVSRVHFEPQSVGFDGGPSEAAQFGFFPRPLRIRISARVELDRVSPGFFRGPHLTNVRINEKTGLDFFFLKPRDSASYCLFFLNDIQSPFGGDLAPLLRNKTGLLGPKAAGDPDDPGLDGHFQVEGKIEAPL